MYTYIYIYIHIYTYMSSGGIDATSLSRRPRAQIRRGADTASALHARFTVITIWAQPRPLGMSLAADEWGQH